MSIAGDFKDFSGPRGQPTKAERELIAASALGRAASCKFFDAGNRVVSPSLINHLSSNRFKHKNWPEWKLHDFGITVAGAVVTLNASLRRLYTTRSMTFDDCEFNDGIYLDEAYVGGDLSIQSCRVIGLFRLRGANITGQLIANDTLFDNKDGDAIQAQGVKSIGWFMDRARVCGRFDINHAEIAGPFAANESAHFQNIGGDAINAQGVKAKSWFLRNASIQGRFNWHSAHISGQVDTTNAKFENTFGDSIFAPNATFEGGILMRNAEVIGGIELSGARISKAIVLDDTKISASRHKAIGLRDASVVGEARFVRSTILGHIHANRAKFQGRLNFSGARITASSVARSRNQLGSNLAAAQGIGDAERQDRHEHHAISLLEACIEGRLVMPSVCPEGKIDLSRARCDTVEDEMCGWPAPLERGLNMCAERICLGAADVQHVLLDGFEYNHFESPSGSEINNTDVASARIRWLTGQPAKDLIHHFNPQPWRQAATVLRAMGYDEAAQLISIERRVRQRLADGTSRFQRWVSLILHAVADYGFNPWKTVFVAFIFAMLCAFVYRYGVHLCGGIGALTDPISTCNSQPIFSQVRFGDLAGANGVTQPYPAFSAVVYSLDSLLPLLDLGMDSYWRPNTNAVALIEITANKDIPLPIGWMLYILSMCESLIGTVLITIAVTGFTGLLTRDER